MNAEARVSWPANWTKRWECGRKRKKKASERWINKWIQINLKKRKKSIWCRNKSKSKSVWQPVAGEVFMVLKKIHHSSESTHYGGQIAPLVIYIFHVFYLDYCYRCINVLVYRDIFTFLLVLCKEIHHIYKVLLQYTNKYTVAIILKLFSLGKIYFCYWLFILISRFAEL